MIKCSICNGEKEVRHFDLYVIGSEGVWLCLKCQCRLNGFILDLIHEESQKKKEKVMTEKGLLT